MAIRSRVAHPRILPPNLASPHWSSLRGIHVRGVSDNAPSEVVVMSNATQTTQEQMTAVLLSSHEAAEASRILANVADIPIGGSLHLPDLAHDGLGGMNVFHTRRGTWLFQRELYTQRGRFADGLAQCLEEIEFYILSNGHLSGPDRRSGV